MLQLTPTPLDAQHQQKLDDWQNEIDQFSSYADRVTNAKTRFSSRNKPGNLTFDHVKAKLSDMCCGARRCAYCEDSAADEIEHLRPKDIYPEQVFRWSNYVYACGPCNGSKNSKFSIIDQHGSLVDVTRPKGTPPAPPPIGQYAMIDPRLEDPLIYLELDLSNTMYFLPRIGLSDFQRMRACYTIEILRLNLRDHLVEARKLALSSYRARLYEYVQCKQADPQDARLALLGRDIRRAYHRTVWKEMQRQREEHQALNKLFLAAPETLNW